MAKAKTNGAAATEKTAEPSQGGLVFERLGKDFELPTVIKSNMFEAPLKSLQDCKGETVVLLRQPKDKARQVYNRQKALRKLAEALKVPIETAVRTQGDDSVLYAMCLTDAQVKARSKTE